jgi:hypothetical protein
MEEDPIVLDVDVVQRPLSDYVHQMSLRMPFSFARYGDGEWASVLGKRVKPDKNCDGHTFYPAMQQAFRKVFAELRDQPDCYDYWLGMQPMALRMWGLRIDKFLKRRGLHDRQWYDADVFHVASRDGELMPLIRALQDLPVVVVGPNHLRTLDQVFGYNEFIPVPPRNCFLQLDGIIAGIRKALKQQRDDVVAVTISASMPAELIIHELYKDYGEQAFLIDLGSVFDPYVGVRSRKYHQGMTQNAIQRISPGTKTHVEAGSLRRRKTGQRRRGRNSQDP